ncbi:LysR family transcriptional regulator [Sphingomonas sp. RRHST34]|uniref:LysR family transcriptional regulator n=1 Tax=Sphingomonas citri TaxID=2862499 RepID=A0ABS7BIT0_9SPHN|nr:LysR family transcriptional regulator [Sphingomonas citri]MBW6529498.1 LysR family transcriptional regulator [Sphingomonas citri]
MIDRYLLRYFLAVVDQGTFSRAASHCRVTQPTLSVGIAKLETLLGQPLFERSSRRVALTAAGARLAEHARRIEAGFLAAEQAVSDSPAAKLIRLGLCATLPDAWIEEALRTAAVAGERLELVEGRAGELRAALDRGRVDAIVAPLDAALPHRALFDEPYAMAFARDHPFAARVSVEAEELAAEPMVVRRHCEMLAETSRFFTARGIRPFMAARTHSDSRALAYVRAGLATTLLPACYADPALALVPLAGFDQRRTVALCFAPDSRARAEGSVALARIGDRLAELGAAAGAMFTINYPTSA